MQWKKQTPLLFRALSMCFRIYKFKDGLFELRCDLFTWIYAGNMYVVGSIFTQVPHLFCMWFNIFVTIYALRPARMTPSFNSPAPRKLCSHALEDFAIVSHPVITFLKRIDVRSLLAMSAFLCPITRPMSALLMQSAKPMGSYLVGVFAGLVIQKRFMDSASILLILYLLQWKCHKFRFSWRSCGVTFFVVESYRV